MFILSKLIIGTKETLGQHVGPPLALANVLPVVVAFGFTLGQPLGGISSWLDDESSLTSHEQQNIVVVLPFEHPPFALFICKNRGR